MYTKALTIFATLLLLHSCGTSQSTIEYNDMVHKVDLDRFEDAILAFEDFDRRARYHSDMVVFTGSSSIRMWTTLNQDMSPFHAVNRGFGGSTLPEMNHYFDRLIGKFRPKVIFLYCGENDIAEGYTAEESYASYLEFIRLCTEKIPNTHVIYISMKPSQARWELWADYSAANALIKKHTEKHDWIEYCDVSKVMLAPDGTPDESIFIEDKLHMNAKGYALWTRVIKPIMQRVGNMQFEKY